MPIRDRFPSAALRMWRAGGRNAQHLAAYALAMVLASSIMAALSPVVLQRLIDLLNQSRTMNFTMEASLLVSLYVGCKFASKAVRELQELFLSQSDQRFHRCLSSVYFLHVLSLPMSFHLARHSGAVSQTLTNGLLGFRIILQHLVNSVVPLMVEFAAMSVILILMGHTIFAGLAALSLVCYAVAFWLGTGSVGRLARKASLAQIDASAILTDSVLNVEAIKSFRAEQQLADRFGAAVRAKEHCWRDLLARKTVNGVWVACIFAGTLAATLVLAIGRHLQGTMTVGELVLVTTYLLQLVRPVEAAGFAMRDIAQGWAFIGEMTGILSIQAEVIEASPERRGRLFGHELRFERVTLSYDGKRNAIRGLNLVVPPGSVVAIVGKSGSGKSSIARLVLRFLEPTDGKIVVGNKRLSDIPIAVLRSAIGLVPQEPILIDDSIAYNISIGNPRTTRSAIAAAAELAGLDEFVDSLPDRYETKVGERGLRLSGGERQRIAIARAVFRHPELYIFDEATSSLDAETEKAITDNLRRLAECATVIVITHRLATATYADKIVVLDDGAIAEQGSHPELIALNGLYAAMWRAQQREGFAAGAADSRTAEISEQQTCAP